MQTNELSRRQFLKVGGAALGGLVLNLLGVKSSRAASIESGAISGITSLNYDESNGDRNIPGQTKQIADYLRRLSEKDPQNVTESELTASIVQIQQEAANAKASTIVDVEQINFRDLPIGSTWLVWNSNRDNILKSPSDVHLPLGMPGITFPHLQGQVAIVQAFDSKVPDRHISTFACKPGTPRFWAVAIK